MLAHILLIAIVAICILLMLIRPRDIPEVWWVGGGAVLLVLLRLVPLKLAGRAIAQGTDVYLFLIGMMLLSELAREHGVFDWISSRAVRESRGRCSRLFALVYVVGTVTTICMSNDATAVVLTPAVLSAVRKARVEPLPYLFVCAMIANAASFVLPISNPANLVVFHANMPPLGRWLAAFLFPSLCSIVATYAVLRWYFRGELGGQMESDIEDGPLPPNGRVVVGGLIFVVAVLLAASGFGLDLGLPTCLASLLITAMVSIRAKESPVRLAKEISWATVLLVAALFVMVNAVEELGALHHTQAALVWAQHLPVALGAMVVSFLVGIGNNVVNNLPLGLIAGATVQAAHVKGVLANSVMIGVDLGPNLSVTGSLATILWLLAMRKEGLNVSAWDFLKAGLFAMPIALLASMGGILLMHALARV